MEQVPLEWAEQSERDEPSEVALERETTEAVMMLIARALIAVVRAAEEDADER